MLIFFTYLIQFLKIYIISANLDCKKMNPSSCDPKFFLQLYTRIVFSATNSAQCPPSPPCLSHMHQTPLGSRKGGRGEELCLQTGALAAGTRQ